MATYAEKAAGYTQGMHEAQRENKWLRERADENYEALGVNAHHHDEAVKRVKTQPPRLD